MNRKEKIESITFIGLCTDVCVISNVLLTKAFLPEVPLIVDAKCCAGVTNESHEYALKKGIIMYIGTNRRKKVLRISLISVSIIILLTVIFFAYFGSYYHAGEEAVAALSGSETVKVIQTDTGYLFDGPSEDAAFIFYPGAKVEAISYAPLMLKLSEAGIDCFLVEMPFNFALFDENAADKITGEYDYSMWILGGHSLGGVAASAYSAGHTDAVDGLVLLASYSTIKIEDSIKVCSVYGSEDGCLNKEQYEKNLINLPETTLEYIISGGNHAGFGVYGSQKGDGTASVSGEEQQGITAEVISAFFADFRDGN